MIATPVLELTDLGKSYRSYSSTWWRAAGWITGTSSHFTENWVLRGVSMSVSPGEAIGIVGRNGAGKSTLLKLIAGALAPTEGLAMVRGRISAILELGMGFNPEFTGRENATHACGLLGYDRDLFDELISEIESFADVGRYFDQPMRTYSSGMLVRVAFGVATAVRPDILIVDEALSVGDAAFQRKSYRRIEEFQANGTSLLLVSHDTETIKKICQRATWLAAGRVEAEGAVREVCDAYERATLGAQSVGPVTEAAPMKAFLDQALASDIEVQYGDRNAEIFELNISSTDADGVPVNALPDDAGFSVAYKVLFRAECRDVHFGMMIKTIEGICVYSINTAQSQPHNRFVPGEVAEVRFALENHLVPGTYFLNCGVNHATSGDRALLHRRVDAARIRVFGRASGSDSGISHLRGRTTVRRVNAEIA